MMKSCWETRHSSTTTTYSYSRKRSLVDVGVPARLKDSSRRFKTSAGGPAVANAAKIWRLPPSRQQPNMFENIRGSAMEKRCGLTRSLIQFLVCRCWLCEFFLGIEFIKNRFINTSISRRLYEKNLVLFYLEITHYYRLL